MASQELEVLQESSNDKNCKRGKTRKWTEVETEKLIDLLEKNTCLWDVSNKRRFFAFLFSSMSSLTRSAARHFRVLRRWIYLRFSAMIQHEPLWNLRNAQHIESLLRSFEHPAQQHLNKHSTCWELVQWTNPVHLHATLNEGPTRHCLPTNAPVILIRAPVIISFFHT